MPKLMKISALTIAATVLVGTGGAQAGPENFGGNGNAWTNDYGNHYVNNNNGDLRQDWDTGRRAVPGRAAAAQAGNPTTTDSENNVISRPDSTLVDPHKTLR